MKIQEQPLSTQIAITVRVVSRYWPCLPISVRCWYDLEDMVSEILTHLLLVARRYDPTKASVSTFTYTVAQNQCRELLIRHRTTKRQSVDIPPSAPPVASDRWLHAVEHCELVLTQVSPETRQFLAGRIFGEPGERERPLRGRLGETVKKELREWNKILGGCLPTDLAIVARAQGATLY